MTFLIQKGTNTNDAEEFSVVVRGGGVMLWLVSMLRCVAYKLQQLICRATT